jgi:hypothetical protein
MNRKRFILIPLVLVFGMAGYTFAGDPPAGAVAVYNCEQGADPNILYDSVSGWNAVWEDGEGSFIWDATDGSLDVTTDGATFAANPNLINNVGDDWSFAVWVKPAAGAGGENALLQSRNYVHTINFIDRSETVRIKGPGWGGPGVEVWFPDEDRDKWSHWAFVRSAAGVSIYRDGIKLGSTSASAPLGPYPEDLEDGVQFAIGSEPDGSHRFRGKMDDLRFYHRTLTSAEILAYTGDADMARDPSPNSSKTALSTYDAMATAAMLTWTAGDSARAADGHHVYFGTDRAAVGARDASVDQGLQTATSLPVTTELGQTYYWVVDEIADDGSVTPGMLWTFTLGAYIDVDNMEAYNSENPPNDNWPYNTWLDGFVNGTGSQVAYLAQPFMERGEKQGGGQSLPFIYDNSKSPFYSEMSALIGNQNITVGSDWTVGSPTALELWFYGAKPENDPETLYLGLKSGGSAVVTGSYSGVIADATDNADVNQPEWQRLIVPLADFSAGGVDLADVQEIYVGAGNRAKPAAGGKGTLFVDTIRLYPSRTLRALTGIELDWNEDGVVNAKELGTFAENWRLQDKLAKPSTGVWLKLDDTNTTVVDGKVMIEDSSEFDNVASIGRFDGSAPTSVTWDKGACLSEAEPGALDLGTSGNVISVTNLPDVLKKAEAMTITMWWYNYSNEFEPQGCWVEGIPTDPMGPGDSPPDWSVWAIDYEGGDSIRFWDAADDNLWGGPGFNAHDLKDQWTHLAFVLSPEGTAYYINGELLRTDNPFGSRSGWQQEEGPGADLRTIRFGVHQKWSDGADRTLQDCLLDDIRVYDNVLNESSISSLMNCGEGSVDSFYVPLESIANIVPKVGDEGVYNPDNVDAVDFLDFAKFAESWRASSPPWPY